MRILIATGIFKPELGGPATFAAEIAARLSAGGHTVAVITYSNQAISAEDKAFPFLVMRVVRKKSKLLNYFSYFFAILHETKNFDFIYSLDWFSAGLPIMLACFLTRKKYIVRVGGGYIWEKYLAEGRPPVTLKQFYH